MVIKVKIKDIQPAFNNAHRALWKQKLDPKIHKTVTTRLQGQWWMEEHNVVMHGQQNGWTYAEFLNEEYFTWFMLKWS